MKVTVEERPGLEEPEVIIRCGRMDGQVSRLAELLRLSGARLTLSNGEVVVANRQYVPAIKQKLGL